MIALAMTDTLIERIAREQVRGRRPFIGTAGMRGLFDYGSRLGESGNFWEKRPPGWDD